MNSVSFRISTFPNKVLNHLPPLLRHIIIAILDRVRDPKPEMSSTKHQGTEQSGTIVWGWLPILALTNAWGVLVVAYAYISSRYVTTDVSIFFWLGLLIIFVPSTIRLISPKASRFERMGILCVVGISLYIIKIMFSPLYFSGYDEFLHWFTANGIVRSGHLFGQNALLPVSPDYPGLEIVTTELSKLSGLNTYYSGIIVIGVARLLMILALFLFNEQIVKSARVAGIATIIYVTNAHFLFFDAQFAYESLALPLAVFMMFVMTRHETLNKERHWMTFTAWIVLGAVVVTHHLTDFIFDGFLLLWVLIYAIVSFTSVRRSNLAQTALFAVLISVIYVLLIGKPVVEYVSSFLAGAFTELGRVLTGSSGARRLFVDYGGQPTPLWERIISLSSVAIIISTLPFGLLCLWQRYRSNALACMFGIVSLFYPLSLAFRFTNTGGEITDRTTAFLFIPLSCVLAIFITQFWPTRWLTWKQTTLITAALTILFLGGVIVGSGPPWALLPGKYLVTADVRSIEPEGIQAAIWAGSYLGPNNRVATDRINQLLMGVYGEQRIITGLQDNIEVSPIFFSSSLGPNEIAILRSAKIRYLVVDLRLATGLPRLGYYFGPAETGAFHYIVPIDQGVLTKFNTIPQINRVFDGGDIIIYDVRGLINAP
jgi:hypothetical protein